MKFQLINPKRYQCLETNLIDLAEQCQDIGIWPSKHPLPLPKWANDKKPNFPVDNIYQYEHLISQIDLITQNLLKDQNYNSVDNFLGFHNGFMAAKEFDEHLTLKDYYQRLA